MKVDSTSEMSIGKHESCKIYVSMSQISSNIEIPRRDFGHSLQLTNWILDSGATCHMTPDISDYVPGSLVETYKYIEVVNGHYLTAK